MKQAECKLEQIGEMFLRSPSREICKPPTRQVGWEPGKAQAIPIVAQVGEHQSALERKDSGQILEKGEQNEKAV